jgi:hypothetical protein
MPNRFELLPGDAVLAVESLAEAFEARSIRYALIGGLAFTIRGRPRYTQDVDFLLEVPQHVLPELLAELISRGFALDPAVVIPQFVREYMTSFKFGHIRIDWIKPILPLYYRTLADAAPVEWTDGHSVQMASAEGLVLTKLVAFRAQDQVDMETLLTANRDAIDVELIRTQWSVFADSEPERTAWLEAVIEKRVVRRE